MRFGLNEILMKKSLMIDLVALFISVAAVVLLFALLPLSHC